MPFASFNLPLEDREVLCTQKTISIVPTSYSTVYYEFGCSLRADTDLKQETLPSNIFPSHTLWATRLCELGQGLKIRLTDSHPCCLSALATECRIKGVKVKQVFLFFRAVFI